MFFLVVYKFNFFAALNNGYLVTVACMNGQLESPSALFPPMINIGLGAKSVST